MDTINKISVSVVKWLNAAGVKANYYECKLADLSPVRRNHFTL